MKITSNFTLLKDLGIIETPKDYVHKECLNLFMKKNQKKFNFFDNRITDEKFPNPTKILKPGEKFYVQAFRSVKFGTTSCSECITFINIQKAVYLGARGISLVFEQKRNLLEIGYSYHSLEENKEILSSDSYAKLPCLCYYSNGFSFYLSNLDGNFSSMEFLVFTLVN